MESITANQLHIALEKVVVTRQIPKVLTIKLLEVDNKHPLSRSLSESSTSNSPNTQKSKKRSDANTAKGKGRRTNIRRKQTN